MMALFSDDAIGRGQEVLVEDERKQRKEMMKTMRKEHRRGVDLKVAERRKARKTPVTWKTLNEEEVIHFGSFDFGICIFFVISVVCCERSHTTSVL